MSTHHRIIESTHRHIDASTHQCIDYRRIGASTIDYQIPTIGYRLSMHRSIDGSEDNHPKMSLKEEHNHVLVIILGQHGKTEFMLALLNAFIDFLEL